MTGPLLAQAGQVDPTWLHNAWIVAVIVVSLAAGPLTTWLTARRTQKREVQRAETYVTSETCGLLRREIGTRLQTAQDELGRHRARLDALESGLPQKLDALRLELRQEIAGVRADTQQLIRALGRMQGQMDARHRGGYSDDAG
jgi:hypothetical protein